MTVKRALLAFLCGLLLPLTALADSAEAFDIYGKPYHFTLPPGKWVIINYWATWCPYCLHEIPELNRLAKTIDPNRAVFFGVNYDKASDSEQQAFADANNIQYTLMHSNPFRSLIGDPELPALPTTYVISPKGSVSVLYGELQVDEVLAQIR